MDVHIPQTMQTVEQTIVDIYVDDLKRQLAPSLRPSVVDRIKRGRAEKINSTFGKKPS